MSSSSWWFQTSASNSRNQRRKEVSCSRLSSLTVRSRSSTRLMMNQPTIRALTQPQAAQRTLSSAANTRLSRRAKSKCWTADAKWLEMTHGCSLLERVVGRRTHDLEVIGTKSRVLRDSRQHSGADLLAIMEGEYKVQPTLARQCAMRTGLALESPSDAMECSKNSSHLRRLPPP